MAWVLRGLALRGSPLEKGKNTDDERQSQTLMESITNTLHNCTRFYAVDRYGTSRISPARFLLRKAKKAA
jgi:hypothetical protein